MATRAVYSFCGFPDAPLLHLTLPHDGYPTGAARRFAEALRHRADGVSFLAAFLHSQSEAVVLTSVAEAADADYRYRVRFLPPEAIDVTCWRRLPTCGSWIPRCGPLPLAAFIQRFLPAETKPGAADGFSASGPPGEPPGTLPARG